MSLSLMIQILALGCLALATFGLLSSMKLNWVAEFNWGWAGLFLWLLSLMIGSCSPKPVVVPTQAEMSKMPSEVVSREKWEIPGTYRKREKDGSESK